MLKPSDFNNAVPKFTNGNYANNPLDPTNIEEPGMQDYNRGVEPLETLPAQWWNWLCYQFTSRFNKLNTYVLNLFNEVAELLSLLNITPDGTESVITKGQLKNFFKELYPSYVSDKLSLGTTYVPQSRTVNGHALTSNVTVTKSDVGLGSVVNTGDSATPVRDGTTKFTTGGAYNILTSIAPYFSTSTAYSVGALVSYSNKFYECTTAHSAGAWNASHFTERSISYLITNCILPALAQTFSTNTSYAVGAFVIYQNKLYKCTTAHSAGAWNASHFTLASLGGELELKADKTSVANELAKKADLLDLAPDFSTSTAYAVGDYVIYNGNLYRCTVARSAGAWNASHFTAVTVGDELELKADKTSLAVPSDAVLHYSFDEVPDLPDGTAIYKRDKNWTSVENWINFAGHGTVSVIDNVLTSTRTANGLASLYNASISAPANSIMKVKVVNSQDSNVVIATRLDGVDVSVKTINVKANIPTDAILAISGNINQVLIRDLNRLEAGTLKLLQIYIGDGSYSTPIIDNANGQNNAINNGGIAVKGVSGKGVYFIDKYCTLNDFNFSSNFSVSVWVKPENNTNDLNEYILRKQTSFILRNGSAGINYVALSLYGADGQLLSNYRLADLLTPSVWSNLIITREGTVLKCYINGQLVKTVTLSDSTIATNSDSLTIGGSSIVNTRNQSLDDLLIFDRALTDDEVQALYLNKANTPKYYEGHVSMSDSSATSAIPVALCTGDKTVGKAVTCALTYNPSTGVLSADCFNATNVCASCVNASCCVSTSCVTAIDPGNTASKTCNLTLQAYCTNASCVKTTQKMTLCGSNGVLKLNCNCLIPLFFTGATKKCDLVLQVNQLIQCSGEFSAIGSIQVKSRNYAIQKVIRDSTYTSFIYSNFGTTCAISSMLLDGVEPLCSVCISGCPVENINLFIATY